MAIPLIVLAIGSVLAGYVGVPHALGGSNRIETFLEPSFEVSEGVRHETTAADAAAVNPIQPASAQQTEAGAAAHAPAADEGTELMLMALSSGVAVAGIGIAIFFWARNRRMVDGIAQSASGLHRLLLNKYYVDELYDAAVVQPIKQLSTLGLWKGVDAGLIDGAVNGVGQSVRAASGVLRRTQTGSVRTYAASLFLGVVLIVGYYLLR
jgi:NADH-quinone oxidoreductase subunit L